MKSVRQTSHPANNPPVWLNPDRHDHWGSPRPAGLSDLEWRCYGDRYPNGQCRWLTDTEAGQARAEQLRNDYVDELWIRVRRSARLMRELVSA